MKLNCVIVDDEPLALDVLSSYIEKIEDLQLVARLENAIEAFNILSKKQVDVLFLDIQMPKLTGLDLLRNIKNPPKVIFTTAYREYALEGYELDVVDYLLKPISFDRFLRAINKVYQNQPTPIPSYHSPPPQTQFVSTYSESFIYLKSDKKMVKIPLNKILYIESLKDYIRVKTYDKTVTAYQRISHMESKLPDNLFMRIHRSFIVALDKIDAYSSTSVEISDTEIPIGRNYRNIVLKALNQLNLLNK